MQTFFILLAGLLLYVAMVFACLRELNRWGRDMDRRAARREREHQEYMITSKMDERRRWEDHERFMKRLDARGRSRPSRPRRAGP